MSLHTLNGLILAASLALVAGGLWQRDRLPAPTAITPAALPEPVQVAERSEPFKVVAGGIEYTVSPLYRYELNGLVVSRHDTSVWWDVTHRDWKDHLNVADLCVVWGDNLTGGVYQDFKYSSGTFTCYAATDSAEAAARFDPTALSNNHLLAHDPRLATLLRSVRPGDQVRVRGWLAEYAHDAGHPFRRGTSTRRDDSGNGACETIWVQDAQVLRTANRLWRTLLPVGWIGILAAVILWMVLPARLHD